MRYLTLLAIVSVVLCAQGCAAAPPRDDWTRADTKREVVYAVVLALDSASTANIRNHPGMYEANPFVRSVLGPQPDPAETLVASALVGTIHYLLARRMRPERRRVWQYVAIAGHGVAWANNCRNGLC